jgi:predicted CopG family antitoxin
MSTTVQISNETRRLLEKLKNEMGLKSYDEVIGKLAKKESRIPDSLFGTCKGSKPFRREPELEHKL